MKNRLFKWEKCIISIHISHRSALLTLFKLLSISNLLFQVLQTFRIQQVSVSWELPSLISKRTQRVWNGRTFHRISHNLNHHPRVPLGNRHCRIASSLVNFFTMRRHSTRWSWWQPQLTMEEAIVDFQTIHITMCRPYPCSVTKKSMILQRVEIRQP